MKTHIPAEATSSSDDANIRARREELLWEELRSVRDLLFRTLQWGVTVLASLQTAIFFLLREVRETMVTSGQLKATDSLPIERYLVGTLLLCVVTVICCYLVALSGNRYRKTREQLVETNYYGIKHGEVQKVARYAVFVVFCAFPLLDIVIRMWVHVHFE